MSVVCQSRCVRAAPRRAASSSSSSSSLRPTRTRGAALGAHASAASSLQFIRGIDEPTVPDIKLTRSRDGSQGTALFYFESPAVFENSGEGGEITGLYMVDEEGELNTVDVVAKFRNGQPAGIEAKYVMKSPIAWDRFMRFMQRYAESNNLGFNKS